VVYDTEVLIHKLGDALRRNSRAGSAQLVKDIIRAKPPLAGRWRSMAAIAKKNGEVEDALAAMDYYCASAGNTPPVQFERAALLAQLGQLEEADRILAKLPPGTPTMAEYYYSSGTLSLNLGRVSEAREKLQRACKAAPYSGQSWLALSIAGPMQAADIDALMAVDPGLFQSNMTELSAYHYALGNMFHEAGDYRKAFASFSVGAQKKQSVTPYKFSADKADAVRVASGWQMDKASRPDDIRTPTKALHPIFVSGLPRSGTTLVEQILNSHSKVVGGEELGLMQLVTQDSGNAAADFARFRLHGGSSSELANLYCYLLRQRHEGNGFFVDKSLDTSRFAGLIAAIFPASPIIWLRRDPLDCAWSAYRTWFLRGMEWSWSLSHIAYHFAVEDALFTHWSSLLGEKLLVVDYADLVQNPEIEIDRITRFCGLQIEPAQLSPHENRRPVKTASVIQVRRPIYTTSVGNSAHYRAYMDQFVEAYETARLEFCTFV